MTKNKTIISIHDDKIQYLTLAKNEYGFYVQNYDSAELSDGIIKNGEILKAEFLYKILSKIQKKIQAKSIHLILPHSHFLFDLHHIDNNDKKKNKKIVKKYLRENLSKISWAATHAYEYDLFEKKEKLDILFRAIPQDMYRSYEHIFKRSGFVIESMYSELVSFQHLFEKNKIISQIFVDNNHTYLLDYKDGIFISDKKFNFSKSQCLSEIKKNIKVSDAKAISILKKYGVLETHDKNILRKLERNMTPIFDFVRKNNNKEDTSLYVHFRSEPLKGFSNRIRKILKSDIYDLCVLCSSKYTFQDVLSIHKKDSYEFEPLMARALAVFDKK